MNVLVFNFIYVFKIFNVFSQIQFYDKKSNDQYTELMNDIVWLLWRFKQLKEV